MVSQINFFVCKIFRVRFINNGFNGNSRVADDLREKLGYDR